MGQHKRYRAKHPVIDAIHYEIPQERFRIEAFVRDLTFDPSVKVTKSKITDTLRLSSDYRDILFLLVGEVLVHDGEKFFKIGPVHFNNNYEEVQEQS